jgi:hypothetical protein
MLQQILKLIRALLSSLYMLFEGMPALDHLRSWFGGEGVGRGRASTLFMVGAAALLGSAAFLVLFWMLRKRMALGVGRRPGQSSEKTGGGAQ